MSSAQTQIFSLVEEAQAAARAGTREIMNLAELWYGCVQTKPLTTSAYVRRLELTPAV